MAFIDPKAAVRFIVTPDGTISPLEGCMLIDVPMQLIQDDMTEAHEYIMENASDGYTFGHYGEDDDDVNEGIDSYYRMINDLLMEHSDEQLMCTPTMNIPDASGDGDGEYVACRFSITDEDNDVLDENHLVIVPDYSTEGLY
jgi:hypothetical protein